MNYLSTTDLRTKSSKLISLLIAGQSVDLIYRSRIIAEIKPKKTPVQKTIDSNLLGTIIKDLGFPRLTLKEIDRRYRSVMTKKHDQNIS